MEIQSDPRFRGIEAFEKKIWLSSPTMHGEEMTYMAEAYHSNWMSTTGNNIDELERAAVSYTGAKYAVALSSGTAAIHLAVKLAAEQLYHSSGGMVTPEKLGVGGSLYGKKVFCSDMTFSATANPIAYEGGEAVFIDAERDTWNMDPDALSCAFSLYPDVKLVILTHLYGTPGKLDALLKIAKEHGALVIEDAAESFGATYKGKQTGTFGCYNVISFNGNKIITGSSGGMLLTDSLAQAEKARKWSTQSREDAPWYQHEELGYNYRISNVVAGVARGQMPYLEEHIHAKKKIYRRYKEGLRGLPVSMNPYEEGRSAPNYWLSCLLIEEQAMCKTVRGEREALYLTERGKSCPSEILEVLAAFHAEGRPIWKPMHLQPIYRNNNYVTVDGLKRGGTDAYQKGRKREDVGEDIFHRGICLPSDIKMTEEEQDRVIEIIARCFQ